MRRKNDRQSGVVILEFTISFLVFFMMLVGFVVLSRGLLTWLSAQEATRMAARTVSLCDLGSDAEGKVLIDLKYMLTGPGEVNVDAGAWLEFKYFPESCTASTCEHLQVKLKTDNIVWQMNWPPVLGGPSALRIPENPVTVLREAMSTNLAPAFPLSSRNKVCVLV